MIRAESERKNSGERGKGAGPNEREILVYPGEKVCGNCNYSRAVVQKKREKKGSTPIGRKRDLSPEESPKDLTPERKRGNRKSRIDFLWLRGEGKSLVREKSMSRRMSPKKGQLVVHKPRGEREGIGGALFRGGKRKQQLRWSTKDQAQPRGEGLEKGREDDT